jgi:hypothetical protein
VFDANIWQLTYPLGNLFSNSFHKLGGVVTLPPKAEDIIKVISEYRLYPYLQFIWRFYNTKPRITGF